MGRPIALVFANKILPDKMDINKFQIFFVCFLEYLIKQ